MAQVRLEVGVLVTSSDWIYLGGTESDHDGAGLSRSACLKTLTIMPMAQRLDCRRGGRDSVRRSAAGQVRLARSGTESPTLRRSARNQGRVSRVAAAGSIPSTQISNPSQPRRDWAVRAAGGEWARTADSAARFRQTRRNPRALHFGDHT